MDIGLCSLAKLQNLFNSGERLDRFIVGLTNEFSPSNFSNQYSLCAQYPGRAGDGARLTVTCNPSAPTARYVIIQQPEDGMGCLTVCEMEVYALNDTGL